MPSWNNDYRDNNNNKGEHSSSTPRQHNRPSCDTTEGPRRAAALPPLPLGMLSAMPIHGETSSSLTANAAGDTPPQPDSGASSFRGNSCSNSSSSSERSTSVHCRSPAEAASDERSHAFAMSFLGVDLRSLDGSHSPNVASPQQQPQPNTPTLTQLLPSPQPFPPTREGSLEYPPTARPSSKPISIVRGRRGQSTREGRAETHPDIVGPEVPPDVHEADGHVWRAKYCLLEGGALYFYQRQSDAETPEARAERRNHIPNAPCYPGSLGDSSAGPLDLSPTDTATTAVTAQNAPNYYHLAQSPIPVKAVRSEGDRSWEKCVVVSAVGTVRSAEAEYGPNSFELVSADDPCERLVLRAGNPDERDEWLLQFVRSFAAHLHNVVESAAGIVASSTSGTAATEARTPLLHGRKDLHRVTLSPDGRASTAGVSAGGALSPRGHPSCLSPSASSMSCHTTPIPLSHGHGRHSLHRRRCQPPSEQQIDRLAQSYQDPSPPLLRLHLMPQHARLDVNGSGDNDDSAPLLRLAYRSVTSTPHGGHPHLPPQQQQRQQQPPQPALRDPERTATPEFSAPQSDYPETERPPPSARHGRYVPPQLRAAAAAASRARDLPSGGSSLSAALANESHSMTATPTTAAAAAGAAATSLSTSPPPVRKYIPPQLRNKGSGMPSMICAPTAAPSPIPSPSAATPTEAPPTGADWSPSEMHFVNVKLGGCADPELVGGSILDDIYIPRKASRVSRSNPDPFGSTFAPGNGSGPRWEIGATSLIGVRESNEDAYVIVGDLLEALKSHHGDSSASPQTIWEPAASKHPATGGAAAPSLFAIFDGHCGDHAARFAAERLLPVLHEQSLLDRHVDASFGREAGHDDRLDRLCEAVRETVSTLDEAFCKLCVEAGRQWESGTTALIAALVEDHLVIANLGDARGVLCRSVSDEWDHESLENDGWTELSSVDEEEGVDRCLWREVADVHSPQRDDERARIERANGWVTTEKEIPVGQWKRMALFDQDVVDILKRCCFNNDHYQPSPRASAPQRIIHIARVCGELAVSRAIGDRDFKAAFNDPRVGACQLGEWDSSLFLPYPDDHCRSFVGDLISNQPEFRSLRIGGHGVSEEFLLLACDGLWDVLDADDAVRLTRNMLYVKGWSAKRAANRLAELAVHLGSSDNITVIVLRFFHEQHTRVR